MGIHMQEEISMDILSRLPVRSLLRFKCVSKSWMTLISDPYFTMKHLYHAKNNQNSEKILISQRRDTSTEFSLYCSLLSSVQRVEEVQKCEFPSNGKPWYCRLYCCYDSLALIGVCNYPDYEHSILLWNPCTRESIVLPQPKLSYAFTCTWGLGYDSSSDDYKILMIDKKSHTEILALKSGSWRLLPTYIRPIFIHTDSLVFVHGAFHWVGDVNLTGQSMVSFSISDEVYGEIPLPEQMCSVYTCMGRRGVSLLGGMLCAYSHHGRHTEDIFRVWVMKDYSIKGSWTELFNIQGTGFSSIIPKYRFSDGEVLLYGKPLSHSFEVFRTSKGPFGLWPQSDVVQKGFVYTESLFFPKLIT